jgi:hypothetical protein
VNRKQLLIRKCEHYWLFQWLLMNVVIPNIDWYLKISKERGVLPRCPFASARRCPRYYQSISLLHATGATNIETEIDQSLYQQWEKSPLWPLIVEQETSVDTGGDGSVKMVSKYCPEVSHLRYGLFASHLARYADKIDKDIMYTSLVKRGIQSDDWRWEWASVRPEHYTACPFYSLLQRPDETTIALENVGELFEFKPGFWGVNINIKKLITRFCIWWLRKVSASKQN